MTRGRFQRTRRIDPWHVVIGCAAVVIFLVGGFLDGAR